jgi:photosystem II stability/assembly factor-like uncharacterized protein
MDAFRIFRSAVPATSAFVLIALAAVAPAQENVWTSHGPTDVGWVNDLAIADSVAYAATLNGVFRSDDRGASWQQSGLTGLWIFQVAARPGAALVFALASGTPLGNFYASRDSGETWARVPEPEFVTVVGIDPERLSTVYAGSAGDSAIWKSTDAGATWHRVWAIPENSSPLALAFNSNAIYLLTYDHLYKSVDGGVTWTDVRPPGAAPNSIAAGAAAGIVYAAGSGGFCQSADSATTWTCSTTLTSYYESRILEVSGDSPSNPRILVSSIEGVFLSRDRGATWTRVAGGLESARLPALASDASGSLVLVGTDTQVFRSEDRGDSWTPSRAGLKSVWISALALDPHDPSTVWAGGLGNYGSGPGLFRSMNSGFSWSPAGGPRGPQGVNALAIDPDHPATMYAGWDGVFRTEDGGQTWTRSLATQGLNVLAVDPDSPQRVWAGAGGLFRSDDGARTWEPASITQGVFSILFDDRQPDTIYAGSYWDVDVDYPTSYGGSIFVSHDHGESFTKGTYDLGGAVLSIAQDPFQDGVLYVAAAIAGVFRSADAGVTWESASAGLPSYTTVLQIVADPVRPARLYCSTFHGVFRTIDGARTWQPFSTGLTTLWAAELVISPDGKRLYAGTAGGGVFELDLQTEVPSFPCTPSETRLCLVDDRYAVDLLAASPGESLHTPGAAQLLSDRSGYFGLPFVTGDPEFPEVVVKMLPEGAFGAGGAPVFYSSLTTLPYFLTVTDTMTGQQRFYASNPGAPFCGGADFTSGATESSMSPRAEPAAASETALHLLGGRFSVTLEARHPGSGRVATGAVMSSGDRSGFFSLPDFTGDPQFPEVVVKMIDARAIAGKFWFFYASLTSLDYTLTVTDSVTGAVRIYESATQFCGGADVRAFGD